MKNGFHKMDEMEMHINLQAIRWTYLFLVVTLLIWGTRDFILYPHSFSLAMFLLIAQFLVYWVLAAVLKSRMGEKKALRRALIALALGVPIAAFLLILGFFFH